MHVPGLATLLMELPILIAQAGGSLDKPHQPVLQFIPLLIVLLLGVGLFVYIAAVKFKTPRRPTPSEKKPDESDKEL